MKTKIIWIIVLSVVLLGSPTKHIEAAANKCYSVFVVPKGTYAQYAVPKAKYAKIKKNKLVVKGSIEQVKRVGGKRIKLLKNKTRTFTLAKNYKLRYQDYDGEQKLTVSHFNSLDGGFGFYIIMKKNKVAKILGVS